MSTPTTVMAWAASLPPMGILEELAAFVQQQIQAGHLHDTDTNFLAAFQAFIGSQLTFPPAASGPTIAPAGLPGLANPMTALGDLMTGGVNGVVQRLGVGNAGQVLGVVSGAPAWSASPAATATARGAVVLREVNVKDPAYGAKGDGVTDDTVAVLAALSALGGNPGTVFFPTGTYMVQGNQIALGTRQLLRGDGSGASSLMLYPGSSGDVVRSLGFAGLTGTNTAASPNRFGLRGITLDGNKATCPTGGNCVSFYGYAYIIDDVIFANAQGRGVYTEWCNIANPGLGSMEARVNLYRIENCNGQALYHTGPHDSQFVNGTIVGCGIPSGGSTTIGQGTGAVYFAGNGYSNGTTVDATHIWGNSFDYGLVCFGSSVTLGKSVQIESARVAQLYMGNGQNRLHCKLFSGNVAPTTVKGLVFDPVFPGGMKGEVEIEDCGGAAVDFANAGGLHDLIVRARYSTAVAAPANPFPNLSWQGKGDLRLTCTESSTNTIVYDNTRASSYSVTPTPQAASGEYLVPISNNTGTTQGLTSGLIYLAPIDVGPIKQAFRGLGTNISVLGVGGTSPLVHLGLYVDDGTLMHPTGNVLSGSEVILDPTSGLTGDRQVDFAADLNLQPGRYWVAFELTDGGLTLSTAPTVTVLNGMPWYGTRNDLSNSSWKCWTASGSRTASTLTSLGTLSRSTLFPIIGLRAR